MAAPKKSGVFETLKKNVKNVKGTNEKLMKKIKELENRLQKLETQKDINSELSEHAQFAIKVSKGPVKPNEMQKLLTSDACLKGNTMTAIRKHSNNISEIKEQLLCVHDNVECYMKYREEQKKLDVRLIKRIKKLQKTIEEGQKNTSCNAAIPGSSNSNRNEDDDESNEDDNESNEDDDESNEDDDQSNQDNNESNEDDDQSNEDDNESNEDDDQSNEDDDESNEDDDESNEDDDKNCTKKRKLTNYDSSQDGRQENGGRYDSYSKERKKNKKDDVKESNN